MLGLKVVSVLALETEIGLTNSLSINKPIGCSNVLPLDKEIVVASGRAIIREMWLIYQKPMGNARGPVTGRVSNRMNKHLYQAIINLTTYRNRWWKLFLDKASVAENCSHFRICSPP